LHDLDETPHSLRRCGKQAAKMQSKEQWKGEPKKMSRKMRGICAVTRLRIGIWRGMEGNQKWEESLLIINPFSVKLGEKHITTETRSPLRSPFGSGTGLLDPLKLPQG